MATWASTGSGLIVAKNENGEKRTTQQIISAPAIKHVGPEFLLPHHHEHPSALENFGSDLKIQVAGCPSLERISNLPNLQDLMIIRCPELKVLEGLPALHRLTLEDYDMKTLPGYLQDVNRRDLRLNCDISLLASIAEGESGPEWDKFSHIKQVNAYADDDDNNIERKWYVKYTGDPFSFKTNINVSADASGSYIKALVGSKGTPAGSPPVKDEDPSGAPTRPRTVLGAGTPAGSPPVEGEDPSRAPTRPRTVVGNQNNDEPKVDALKDIGTSFIAKCDGLPLAVKVIGGLLRQKNIRRSDWKNVLNYSTWPVSQMPEELNYAVYLSYQDLNPELQSCFLPKSVLFGFERIVAMWIGEGFVHGNSCDLEYLTRDEALVTQKSEAGPTINSIPENIIRLSLENKGTESNKLAWSSLQAHISLRTLIFGGKSKINPGDSLSCFPCLRTLHIEDANFDALSKSLVQLKHLRYLCLDGTNTSRLPKKIAKMKFLQCIDLTNCRSLVKLPRGIGELRQLRYLSLVYSGINNIPRGFGSLTNLRILWGFPAHVEGDWCSLEELGPLNRLTSLDIRGLENVSYSTFAIKVKLGEKVCLSYLNLQCTSSSGGAHRLVKLEEQQHIEKVFDELCPPPCLENLTIEGYFGQRLPRWMTSTAIVSLGCLRILFMEDLPYCTELPDSLFQLPSLEFLHIRSAPGIKRVGPEFLLPHRHEHPSAVENFGSGLKIVVRGCHGLERISNLPNLQNLVIVRCPELKVLEGLPALHRLTLEDYDMETLPGYLKDVNPRDLHVDCDVLLLASIGKGKSSLEWDKFSHIKQVNAYADDDDNNIERKWYVKYTIDPFSFKTNISPSADASGDETEEVLLDKVEQV
ncbi:unnamed protein product [Miscanthus lutarioriparius]|uniref:Disease resistance R13L4/SHOC-2-like LRR domain-containing protein n=1 Tax=Miscanthus lutarioriparius TaxID=422564 RepID=A0A811STM7_9POAL|nr:unnamed protein product [Miscanthus lutarioriparius]